MANFENLQNLTASMGTVQDLATRTKQEIDKVRGEIPTRTSQITNDSGFATASGVESAIASQIGRVYRPGGSKVFEELPEANAETLGYVYNVTNAFATTADFVEGAGKDYAAGTDVGVVEVSEGEYKYNVFANFVDTSVLVHKDGDKVLSDNNFSDNEKDKLDGITAGATKVEASTTAGNIKINGEEKTVVEIADREEALAVINAIFGDPEESD